MSWFCRKARDPYAEFVAEQKALPPVLRAPPKTDRVHCSKSGKAAFFRADQQLWSNEIHSSYKQKQSRAMAALEAQTGHGLKPGAVIRVNKL